MTPEDITAARKALGMTAAALGRALELGGRDPGQQVLRWEAGRTKILGPARVALRYMLAEHAQAPRNAQEAPKAPAATIEPPHHVPPVLDPSQSQDEGPKARRRG